MTKQNVAKEVFRATELDRTSEHSNLIDLHGRGIEVAEGYSISLALHEVAFAIRTLAEEVRYQREDATDSATQHTESLTAAILEVADAMGGAPEDDSDDDEHDA